MNKVFENIHNATKGNLGIALLYASIAGIVVGDFLPTPANALIVYRNKQLKLKLDKGEINNAEYISKMNNVFNSYKQYWWIAALLMVYFAKGDLNEKIKYSAIILGVGSIIGFMTQKQKDAIKLEIDETASSVSKDKEFQFSGPVLKKKQIPKIQKVRRVNVRSI